MEAVKQPVPPGEGQSLATTNSNTTSICGRSFPTPIRKNGRQHSSSASTLVGSKALERKPSRGARPSRKSSIPPLPTPGSRFTRKHCLDSHRQERFRARANTFTAYRQIRRRRAWLSSRSITTGIVETTTARMTARPAFDFLGVDAKYRQSRRLHLSGVARSASERRGVTQRPTHRQEDGVVPVPEKPSVRRPSLKSAVEVPPFW